MSGVGEHVSEVHPAQQAVTGTHGQKTLSPASTAGELGEGARQLWVPTPPPLPSLDLSAVAAEQASPSSGSFRPLPTLPEILGEEDGQLMPTFPHQPQVWMGRSFLTSNDFPLTDLSLAVLSGSFQAQLPQPADPKHDYSVLPERITLM